MFEAGKRYEATFRHRYGPVYFWYIGPAREEGKFWFEDYRGIAEKLPAKAIRIED